MKELILNNNSNIEDIKNLLFSYKKPISKIILETGEYGLLLFHRIMASIAPSEAFSIDEKLKEPYFKYTIFGIEIVLIHKEELNLHPQEIDFNTGFPVKSSTLFVKEII